DEDRTGDGVPVDESARLAGVAVQERPGPFWVREAPVVAADRGAPVDERLGFPRDLMARALGLLTQHPLSALLFEVGVVLTARPVNYVEPGPPEDIERLGGDLQGGVGVVD